MAAETNSSGKYICIIDIYTETSSSISKAKKSSLTATSADPSVLHKKKTQQTLGSALNHLILVKSKDKIT